MKFINVTLYYALFDSFSHFLLFLDTKHFIQLDKLKHEKIIKTEIYFSTQKKKRNKL